MNPRRVRLAIGTDKRHIQGGVRYERHVTRRLAGTSWEPAKPIKLVGPAARTHEGTISVTQQRFGRCASDSEARSVICDGHAIPLDDQVGRPPTALLVEPNTIVATDVLREKLWPAGFVEPGNLAQQVYVLRRALAVDPTVAIETLARRGYRLRAAVAPVQLASAAEPRWRHHLKSLFASFAASAVSVFLAGRLGAGAPQPRQRRHPRAAHVRARTVFWTKRGTDNFLKAQTYFEATVALAPQSALGYAGLAEVYGLRADEMMSGTGFAHKALTYARTAVAKNESSGVAHAALGLALLENKSAAKGLVELRRAIELDPKIAEAHEWYAIQLLKDGNLREAGQHFEMAAQSEPENVAVTNWRAWIRYYQRDFDAAADDFRTALQLNPQFAYAQLGLAEALVQRGKYRDAKTALREVRSHDWTMSRALRAVGAIVDWRLGLHQASRDETQRLQAQERTAKWDGSDEFVVAALALNGNRSDALRLRAKMHLGAYEQRMIDIDPLVGPVFRDLNG